jgi:hexosaminidase
MLQHRSFFLSCVVLLATCFGQLTQAAHIIPQPEQVKSLPGSFALSGTTAIIHNGQLANEAGFLRDAIKASQAFNLDIRSKGSNTNAIRLVIDKATSKELGKEGYRLLVDKDQVVITAPSNTGIFYGIQTLRQLIANTPDTDATYPVACVSIQDKPRFSWRAFMLDEGRYFKGTAVVKQLLDEMAILKMNTFHWHLTDDQGWRIEIKKYPLLTTVGGKRDSTQIGTWNSPVFDGKVHQGYYTQEQIKDVIRYAADRHITIIPEIEMPGHSSAAIAAYPWLGSTGLQIPVPGTFGVHYDVFNVTNPKVVTFLQDVLQEVLTLFPSKVIHIGGDEVKYDQWKASTAIQTFMKEKQLGSPADLQIWFTNKISNYLAGKQRRMMGWNEIMGSQLHEYSDKNAPSAKEKLAKGTIVHFWKGELKLVNEAVSKGYDIVNSYHEYTYLDYSYKSIPLKKSYEFDPIPAGLEAKYHPQILGLGCQMWGEWIPTRESMNKLVFPRMAAYAEVGWTPLAQKNFDAFENAMPFFYNRWDKENINYGLE